MEEIVEQYEDFSKKQLIKKIKKIEKIYYQLDSQKNSNVLPFLPWIAHLGQWHWFVQTDELFFNEKKATNLGYLKEEIPEEIGFEFFTSKLYPADYENVMNNMRRHLNQLSETYEVEYRIKNKDGSYSWYYDQGMVTKRNAKGEALVVSGIVFDISKNKKIEQELKKSNERLNKLVITDELTGAFSRRYMLDQIDMAIQRYYNSSLNFSLIMLDIDDFKTINDYLGHNVGDSVLKKFVDIIKLRIRKTDALSRWGGEEFIILLPDTELSGAIVLAEDIRIQLNHICMENAGIVTASIGVVSYRQGENVDSTIKRVDDLMYQAKFEGKNGVKY